MRPQTSELDQVTVVAYGKQRKESVIGAISSMNVDKITHSVSKLSNVLAGQMAGVVAVQRSGEPGEGSDFWIRGVSTFGANNRPLVLVDGIERDLNLVDPDDVETFSILKDATATAIYGVRGANGVVLITTRKGKEASKPVISGRVEASLLQPTKMPKMANGNSATTNLRVVLLRRKRALISTHSAICSGRRPTKVAVTHIHRARHTKSVTISRVDGRLLFSRLVISVK